MAGTIGLGIDVYVAGLVMHPDESREQERRARRIAAESGAFVASAGFAGATGSGYGQTAGRSGIWDRHGRPLARAGRETGQLARAELSCAARA